MKNLFKKLFYYLIGPFVFAMSNWILNIVWKTNLNDSNWPIVISLLIGTVVSYVIFIKIKPIKPTEDSQDGWYKVGRFFFAGVLVLVLGIFIRFIIFIPLETYIGKVYFISGNLMNPYFKAGDYAVVNKLSKSAKRGDIVFYKDQDREIYSMVYGLPNDKVYITDGKIFINDKEVDFVKYTINKQYISKVNLGVAGVEPIIVPAGKVFATATYQNEINIASSVPINLNENLIDNNKIIGKYWFKF